MILGEEHETHLFTLDAKKIHDNKKLYTLSRIQEELSALNHHLASKNLKKIKVRGTGRNGSRLKIDFCNALVQARIAFLSTNRSGDVPSMPPLPQQKQIHEQQNVHGQEEEQHQHQHQQVPKCAPGNSHSSCTKQLSIETPLRPIHLHQTPKASIDHFFVRTSTDCRKLGSFDGIKEFHIENTRETRNEILAGNQMHKDDDDFGALLASFASPFLQEPLSC
jgi:hypothetical protein